MPRFVLLFLLILSVSGCYTFQPRVVEDEDPFTGTQSRLMYVTLSNEEDLPRITPGFTGTSALIEHGVALLASKGDTLLTFTRAGTDRHYDVPASSHILILTEAGGEPIRLPLLRSYHTLGGPLVVRAKIDRPNLNRLIASAVVAVRVEQVRINEGDPDPFEWAMGDGYRKAFNKGVGMFVRLPSPGRYKR